MMLACQGGGKGGSGRGLPQRWSSLPPLCRRLCHLSVFAGLYFIYPAVGTSLALTDKGSEVKYWHRPKVSVSADMTGH